LLLAADGGPQAVYRIFEELSKGIPEALYAKISLSLEEVRRHILTPQRILSLHSMPDAGLRAWMDISPMEAGAVLEELGFWLSGFRENTSLMDAGLILPAGILYKRMMETIDSETPVDILFGRFLSDHRLHRGYKSGDVVAASVSGRNCRIRSEKAAEGFFSTVHLVRVEDAESGEEFEYMVKVPRKWVRLLGTRRALREYSVTQKAYEAGIACEMVSCSGDTGIMVMKSPGPGWSPACSAKDDGFSLYDDRFLENTGVAVQRMHAEGIVHGDLQTILAPRHLRSANILVSEEHEVK